MRSRRYQKGFWNFVLPAIASVAGGLIGAKGQDKANDANIEMQRETNQFNADQAVLAREFNSAEAAKNREFQQGMFQSAQDYATHMSNTSYQRAVGDLRAAGLNPMLAYSQGGAPSPTISPQSGSSASGPAASSSNSVRLQSSAVAGMTAAAQAVNLQNLQKQGENIAADTELKKAAAFRENNSAVSLAATTEATITGTIPKLRAEINQIQQDTHLKQYQGELAQANTLLAKTQQMVANAQIDKVDADTALTRVNTLLQKLKENEARAYSEKFGNDYGSTVTPYMREILDVLRTLIYGRSATR